MNFRKLVRLPKVDRKLIEDLLFRQEKDPDPEMTPRYTLEVITKEGLDTQKMKDLLWDEFRNRIPSAIIPS